MSGDIARKIVKEMNIQTRHVKRGLRGCSDAISSFSGYLGALRDTGFITEKESGMFLTEFTRILIG